MVFPCDIKIPILVMKYLGHNEYVQIAQVCGRSNRSSGELDYGLVTVIWLIPVLR